MSTTWINRGHLYAPHVTPVIVDCNFVVDSTNGNGLGIRSLKGQGVANVFMHTSATPGKGPNGLLNPNPQAGTILIQMTDNFSRLYNISGGFASPVDGSPSTSTTIHVPAVIVSLGTATTAQWVAKGLPPGVTPAVGVSFIPTATGVIGGSAAVEGAAATGSGCDHMELVGDPNLSLSPTPVGGSPHVGGFIILNTMLANALATAADGTVIGLKLYLSQSSVKVDGE